MLQSCGGSVTSKQEDPVDSAKEANEGLAVDNDASDFAVKAASGGLMEVKLGELAQQNASSQRVKDFGSMMVRDHSKANEELKGLAAAKTVTLPDSVGEEHQHHIDELTKKKGPEFDKAYIDMMVDDHNEDINMFDKASNNLKDPDMKGFAAKTLPTLQHHLEEAQNIQQNMRKQMNNSKDRGAVQ